MSVKKLEELERFLQEDPTDPFTHYAIGLAHASMDHPREAVSKFEEVIRMAPDYVPAYHQLGLLFARIGQTDAAQRALEEGIEVAQRLGDRHAQQEMQEALDEFEE